MEAIFTSNIDFLITYMASERMQHVARCVLPLTNTLKISASQRGQCLLFDWRTNHRQICIWPPGRPTKQAMELMHIHFSESWAIDLKTFLQDNQLTNEEIAVIDAHGTALPLQDGLGADLGELKDVPARDRFPLRIWKKISMADPSEATTIHLANRSTDQPVDRPACHRVLAASRTSLT